MRFFYTIGIYGYYFAVYLASFFKEKEKRGIDGRKHTQTVLHTPADKKNYYWFHCASLGEFEQVRLLIEKLHTEHQKHILITFFSPSGYELRKNFIYADKVLYLPIDTPANARLFFNAFTIEKAFFVKYEFWFNFLNELHCRNIPTYLVSGVFRKNQIFFKPYGKWFMRHLKTFDTFFVQNPQSKTLLNHYGFSNVVVSGDTRFDTVWQNFLTASHNPLIEQFKGNARIIIAGSCWQPEEDILIELLNQQLLPENWKVIFVPHDVSKKHILRITEKLQVPVSIYSKNEHRNNVLIIDVIGELANAYRYGDVAFIGGGFSNALHNILEPAAFGLPVIFGPNHQKYPEADWMKTEGSAFEVTNASDFLNLIKQLSQPALTAQKEKNARFIERFKGATDTILHRIIV